MTDLNPQLRRLKALQKKCGGGAQEQAVDVDTSKMTPYEQGQYRLASALKRTREEMEELDGLGANGPITRRSELSNSIRRELMTMKREAVGLKALAQKENKTSEYQQLLGHVKKADGQYKSRFGRATDDEGSRLASGGTTSGPLRLDTEMGDLGRPMVSLREDTEFAQFFEQTKKNDVDIDQALSRIEAGVMRLQANATGIQTELAVQNTVLDETEAKVDKVTTNLKGVNKKLKDTIKQVDKDKMCIYIFCFLLLLGLAGGIYFVVSHRDQ